MEPSYSHLNLVPCASTCWNPKQQPQCCRARSFCSRPGLIQFVSLLFLEQCWSLLVQGTRCDAQIEPSGVVMSQEERGRSQWDVKRCQSPVLARAEGEQRGRAEHGWGGFLVWMESLALNHTPNPSSKREPSVRYHLLFRWSVLQKFRFLVIFQLCYDSKW